MQILHDVLSNSIKFTSRGVISLKAFASEDLQHAVITVTDSGEWFSEANAKTIFDGPELMLDMPPLNPRRTLGLNTAKELVAEHKGIISAQPSPDGEGCTFFITLPQRYGERHIASISAQNTAVKQDHVQFSFQMDTAQLLHTKIINDTFWVTTVFSFFCLVAYPLLYMASITFLTSDSSVLEMPGHDQARMSWHMACIAFGTVMVLDFIAWLWTTEKERRRLFMFPCVING